MIHIFDFSGIYTQQTFYKNYNYHYYDLKNRAGLSCYCDDENISYLNKLIPSDNSFHINFIDSGNFHYMSFLNLSKIKTDFALRLFDNHPDAQEPIFPLLSCGGWVLESIDKLKNLKQIEFIGVEPTLMKEVKDSIIEKGFAELSFDEKKRIYTYSRFLAPNRLPIYLSIDKDVLSSSHASTSWSQGNMSLSHLIKEIRTLFGNKTVLGVDICGEVDSSSYHNSENAINENANSEILKAIYELNNLP